MEIYRQGDVVLIKVADLPKEREEVKPDKGRTILAYGEVTGHAHALPALLTKQYKAGQQEFVEVLERSFLRHEEHSPIDLPAGLYEKRIAREWSPAGVRRVED